MFDIKCFLDALEFAVEIRELKDLGLSEEEISGFIETFCDSWVMEQELTLN